MIFDTNDFKKSYNEYFDDVSLLDFQKNNQNPNSIFEHDPQPAKTLFLFLENIFSEVSTNFTHLPDAQSKKVKQLGRKRKKGNF